MAQHRVAGSFERGQLGVDISGLGRLRVNEREHAIITVNVGRTQRLAGDWHDALSFFAGALGNQLFDPKSQRIERCGGDEGKLIASRFG